MMDATRLGVALLGLCVPHSLNYNSLLPFLSSASASLVALVMAIRED